ncbi:NAD-glutamate dehydrogenase domain-containing protein [Thermodesulfobium sp. 4217-1]|uniref:NAD-glutamate dehydrogenase domain-containing protein n=1 Tax=Thermodesulfobium sp. 4217-1 TaxID=3120013 RepID=UPI0032219420
MSTQNFSNWQQEYEKLSKGNKIASSYTSFFSDDYRLSVSPAEAIVDSEAFDALLKQDQKQVRIIKQDEGVFFKIYSCCKIPLYEVLPILRNLGLNAVYGNFSEVSVGDKKILIQSYSIENVKFDIEKSASVIQDNFIAIINNVVENDELNALAAKEFLDYKTIDLLRTFGSYLMQVDFSLKRKSVFTTLVKYSQISKLFIDLFEQKFKPSIEKGARKTSEVFSQITAMLEEVNNIQDYKILNAILNVVDSTIRTNFYRDRSYHYISLKIDSSKILRMPLPRPMYEIYVHSYLMEGCHLRGGKVARGGIRWSDRKDDFRLEILELMKTQMVKNAVIVPVGSKGGFIIKQSNGDAQEKAIESYKTLIRGMLDITDNYSVSKQQIRPQNVVCYDDFDPYLVVAADKGTAKFSDIANEIVQDEYNFWLKDAFASGGKFGYDHKELGITSKGALVCTKRHFRELGVNLDNTLITVAGVGDMSGDVFGNGLIELKNVQLKAALNGKEIFIDPNPDIEISYKERKRLYDNALTWTHYNKELLSKGGFICRRDERSIPLNEDVKAFLGTEKDSVSSDELVRLILGAKVDLFWMGGIGTYVKATSETHEEAGDKTNDIVRINANEVRAKVVGEGANLGFTQKARVEYALLGGKINTDSLDNSAGVDMSDQEVNLKILLNDLLESKVVKDLNERNKILKKLTPEVVQRVLDHNYMQSLAISLDEIRSKNEPEVFFELIEFFQNQKLFSETEYSFPSKKALAARFDSNIGYTKPELSIMLSSLKMFVYTSLLKEVNFDKHLIDKYALLYFAPSTRQVYKEFIERHLLKKEIASTYITNLIVNSNGVGAIAKINMLTGYPYTSIIKTLIFIYDLLDVQDIRNEIFSYENKVDQSFIYQTIIDMFYAIERFATNQIYLFGDSVIEYVYKQEMLNYIEYYKENAIRDGIFKSKFENKVKELSKYFSKDLSERIAYNYFIDDFILAYYITRKTDKNFILTIETIEKINEKFGIQKTIDYINSIRVVNEWDRFAQFSMIKKYVFFIVKLTMKVLSDFNGNVDALVAAKKQIFEDYTGRLNTTSKLSANNLHPVLLLYDKLEELL